MPHGGMCAGGVIYHYVVVL